ncbi:MAG: penicillin-binding protein 2 [Cyclobacteriaceae bacterium]|nr:penicillin-binding protein 2 [Cyclobacteriaceae bacterium]MCH8514991.1 penicillin-binding protein 2 [Cyclobacteriaceae bacterium]
MSDLGRPITIGIIFLFVGVIYAYKLFTIQVLDSTYQAEAEKNIVQKEILYPYRGNIYDRHGELLVQNQPAFDILVVPKEVKRIDTLSFCKHFNISKEEFDSKMLKARQYSMVRPSVFKKMIPIREFAVFQDFLVNYPGFSIQPRIIRDYPDATLANALGYIGEIDKRRLARDTTNVYRQGDYIGISGLEEIYEEELRGRTGVKYNLVNVRGIDKGSFKGGAYDTSAVAGKNLMTTIDRQLQAYGERLMKGKRGAIVAIEPATGEILAISSNPTYDPNLLTGREFGTNYRQLSMDTTKPIFNRPVMALYPPGSIFKVVQSLIALEEGVIGPSTRFPCNRNQVNCHAHPNPANLHNAIKYSCNPYFYSTFRKIVNQNLHENTFIDTRIGMEKWLDYVRSFGLGEPLGIDLPNEKGGQIPGLGLYDRIYGENRWKFSTIYSLSIGQGEILVSPLQMANMAAAIANRGYYIRPHLVKKIGDESLDYMNSIDRHEIPIQEKYFDMVVEGMKDAIQGTAMRAYIPDIEICGKTGTAENPHGEDHSVFMAFAPKDDPKIAIAVYVENAGWGGRAAASTASLMIEKYLKGEVNRKWLEEFVLKGDFIY